MKNKLWLLANVFILFASISLAQTKSGIVNYKKEPVWIKMMSDTNANYFETVKAFREFYKDRFLPEEPWEKEQEGGDAFEQEVGLEKEGGKKSEREREREKRKRNPNEPIYAAEVRAFRSWFYSVKPWVRTDGSIVSPAEQQSIINRQRIELNEIEKTNGK